MENYQFALILTGCWLLGLIIGPMIWFWRSGASMRWPYKKSEDPPENPPGWRTVTRFAFWPVLVDLPERQWIWLERYQNNDQKKRYIDSHMSWSTYWTTQTRAVYGYWPTDSRSGGHKDE
jgi:hypothetical protein